MHEGSIKSEQIIEYMEQLFHCIARHVVLSWGGSRTRTSNATRAFLETHPDSISAFRLSPYSPRFNPVELLWAEINWNRMRGFCPKSNV